MLRATQDSTTLPCGSPTGLSPSIVLLSGRFGSRAGYDTVVLLPPRGIATSRVWAPPRSLATTGGIIVYFLFLRVLRCFSSPGWPPVLDGIGNLQLPGLSHSDISGSQIICISPELFAAYHVLHRQCEPRHPPCALSYFPLLGLPRASLTGPPGRFIVHTSDCASRLASSPAPLRGRGISAAGGGSPACVNMSKIFFGLLPLRERPFRGE